MKRTTQILQSLSLLLIILILMGCSPGGKPQDSEHDAGEVALCDLTEDLLGWRVTTSGEITFLDFSPPDGTYFELKDGSCQVSAFFHNEFLDKLSQDQQAQITYNNTVKIEGILGKEGTRLIVSVQKLLTNP